MQIMDIVAIAGMSLFGLAVCALVVSRLYTRASKEISFVRTGFRGQKVIMNGGAIVLPVLHEIISVNMNTLRLEVRRAQQQALITRDRMRVDVMAEFYVRVQPTVEAIADAAQTLGRRTMNPESLKELVEGKFVDALRAVAAEMAMEELHEQRVEFVQKVQHAVSEDLLKNGLELESVSLTALDQTDREFFNPQNAFDAQGLTKLTEEIEGRRKQRNDIEQDTEVQVREKDLEAERKKLEIIKEEEYAKLEQQREIEVRRATQLAQIAKEQAEQQRNAEQAEIVAKQSVDQQRINSERLVEEDKIGKDRAVLEREIEKQKSVELASQDRDIAVADRSKDRSVSQAEADRARALAVTAEEQVGTARETEVAERQKAIELVEAAKEAERKAIAIKVAADAEKVSANDHASAIVTRAKGEADAVRIAAEAEEKRYAVDAEGTKSLHLAENVLAPDVIAMRIKLELIKNLDKIIHESVKPMEAIDGIKIIQLEGLNGATGAAPAGTSGAASAGEGNAAGGGNLSDQLVTAALRYRGQAPLVDALLNDVGLSGGSIEGLTGALNEIAESEKTREEVASAEAASAPTFEN